MNLVDSVCTAYTWQRALGHETIKDSLCCIVSDPAHPDVWDANHISRVQAGTTVEIETVLRRAEEAFAHCRHRLFVVDPLTPPAFVARLAIDDYQELIPTIQLVLEGPLQAAPRDITLRPVLTEADWQSLYALLRQDHSEGARTRGITISEEVSLGMVAIGKTHQDLEVRVRVPSPF